MARPHVNQFQKQARCLLCKWGESQNEVDLCTRALSRTCFPPREIGYSLYPVWHWLHVFSAHGTGFIFPAPDIGYIFELITSFSLGDIIISVLLLIQV